MTVKTPNFGLEAFITGDLYSASVDKRRFTIIDSHLAFISDLVGPGKIQGWDLLVSSYTLTVSSGWGMIDRFITRTFGDYKKTLIDNTTVYVWMRLRPGVIGQISSFSNMASVSYTDSIPPAIPSGLSIKNKSIDSVTLKWDVSTEIDFNYYEIYKSIDNINYSLFDKSYTNEISDNTLSENSIYYYKIKAYDFSGNVSSFSSYLLVITDKDLSIPADPGSVKIVNSKNSVHLTWNNAPYGNISVYRAYVTPVNEERIAVGDSFIVEVGSSFIDMTIKNLVNDQRYSIILKSVSVRDVESEGVSILAFPIETNGPADISEIIITDYQGSSGVSTNGISLSWFSDIEIYSAFDGSSEILIEEYRNDGTVLSSNFIPVLAGYSNKSIEVFPYSINGQLYYKSIESRTYYYITIRNIDSNGIRSAGKRVKHYTKTFIKPEVIKSLFVVDKPDNTLVLKWENSPSIFSYNIVSIKRLNLSDSVETILINKNNVGKSTVFSLDPSFSYPNSRYTFIVSCVDEFGNESEDKTITYEIGDISNLDRPFPPAQQVGSAGNNQNILTWNASQTSAVKGYKIYRANDKASLFPEDFSLIETVSANTFTYVDYEVSNGSSYVYFITTLDLYDKESLNPINDRYINYSLLTLKPESNSTLISPNNLTATIISNSVQLLWEPTSGQFDGYEIYKSFNNKYSFELISTVSSSITSYLDSSALIQSGKIYYMVRKFRNEADVFITESNNNITDSLYLGKIAIQNGTHTINYDKVRSITKLEDPVREETKNRISVHKHEWIDDETDRRISFGSKLMVSDWVSDDNQIYSTNTDISDTTTYSVYLNGEEASSFGILYSLNKLTGVLTFEIQLSATGFEIDTTVTFPFSTDPVVTVEFDNLEEVQNILPKNRIDNLSSQQISSGLFNKLQIPSFSHDGRIKEAIEPIQISTITVDDGYRYAPLNTDDFLGDAVVFYDIIQVKDDSDILISSTSDGIYVSDNFGTSWERKFEPTTPVIKLFYSSRYDTYFAGTNRGILFGQGGQTGDFSVWSEISGAENTKIVRDIIEDQLGNIFCSSDLGVYKLRKNLGQGSFFFQQSPIFGPRSTEAYAMLFDSFRNRIIVSNELGIFESYNSGTLWSFSEEFPEQRPIHSFVQENNYIFAITDFMLWRKDPNEFYFKKIGIMENSSIARKLIIWNNRIYISTDSGLIVTNNSNNIFSDSTMNFENAFSSLKTNSFTLPSSSINIIDNKLFVGSENKVFISEKPGKISLHYEITDKTIPTVYVNGEQQYIGYRFSTSLERLKKFVCFDVKQKLGSIVTIANQYKKFKAKYGGWADANYVAPVSIFINGIKSNNYSLSEKPAQEISQLSLPVYNDRNAHQIGADAAKIKLQTSATNLLEVEKNSDGQISNLKGFTKDNVTTTLYCIEKFISQLYESSRTVEVTDSQGQTSIIPFKIPDFRVLLLSSVANTKISDFGKYKIWSKDAANSSSSIIGHFGNELTSDGILPSSLISGINTVAQEDGFGVQKYIQTVSGSVGDQFPEDYSGFSVFAIANSVDGTVSFSKDISKYNKLEIDIIGSTFSNVSIPHWAIEDTFEWVNSGSPSHFSQVHHANIILGGIAFERLSPGTKETTAPAFNAKQIVPCNTDWYDKFNSTIDYDLFFDHGNKNISIPYSNCVLFVPELEQVWVGGFGGLLVIDTVTKNVDNLIIESDRNLIIKDIKRYKDIIYILDEAKLYFYNINTQKITIDTVYGLPKKLHSIISIFGSNIIVGAEDGIYARKMSSLSWTKVVSTNKAVNVMSSPDAALAVSDDGGCYYSTDGFNWTNVGIINNKIVNRIQKHRSQILFATTSGLYQDGGSFYTKNISLQLLDVVNDIKESSSISVNDIYSDFNKAVIGLSDGRYFMYTDNFVLQQESKLSSIHKVLIIGDDIWLFGYNQFRVSSESFTRKLATGFSIR